MFKIKRKQTENTKELTQLAIKYHQSGSLHKADPIYRKIWCKTAQSQML